MKKSETNHAPPELEIHQEREYAKRVTLIGMLLDMILGCSKVVVGLITQSVSLVADGIHSFTDVVTDLMVLVVTHYARQAPDEEHPYGHKKFETLGTMLMGSILIAIAGAMFWDACQRLNNETLPVNPGPLAISVALLSILGKEAIYRYTYHAGKKIGSSLLLANAWHSRTDAFSSIVVLAALLGSAIGFQWLDIVGALIISVIIAKIGWDLTWESVQVLVDTAPDAKEIQQFEHTIKNTEGVKSVHMLRARKLGDDTFLDLHLQVDPRISVSEGHQIGLAVSMRLRSAFSDIKDITYHIDVEEDQQAQKPKRPKTPLPLPQRERITQVLEKQLGKWLSINHCDLQLHYLNGQIDIDLYLPNSFSGLDSFPELESQIIACEQELPWLNQLRIWKALR
ncbi:Co/Zn/Cd cation transporter [Oleiphilus messinensis]|uniref:Co/Zn/Cd cation transporter n=1 Tax=Oleiphilus messinensis TaxID=141451 RepID=A0A1Y0IBF3_9GAMM|nr:cation diffusion facilitator family transporter [Oleiphilus messinensis]ARU57499.1 Co/Zn/Cd cation transporter [Oleiphilus messinensis]